MGRRGVWLTSTLNLICVIGMGLLLTHAMSNIDFLSWFWVVQFIGIFGAIETFIVADNLILTWARALGVWRKIQSVLPLLACFGFL